MSEIAPPKSGQLESKRHLACGRATVLHVEVRCEMQMLEMKVPLNKSRNDFPCLSG